jgi:type I restriction enzyme S subunit
MAVFDMQIARLSEITEIIMGQSPPGNTYNEMGTGLPFFQGKAEFGEISPTPKKWCSAPKKLAEPGDILISVRAPVGPTNLAVAQCCIGRGLAAIRADKCKLNPDYLRFFLRHTEPILASMGQGSTFTAIGRAELASLSVPLPSLNEQGRIVDILSAAEGIVRLRREAQKKAAEIIPALFLDMFGDPATNPKGWHVTPFGAFGDCRLGKMLDKKKQSGQFKKPYLRNINVQWNRIATYDLLEMDFQPNEQNTFKLNVGDVLICEGGEIGRAAIWDNQIDECYYQKALHRLRPDTTVTRADFVIWLLWHLARGGALVGATTHATIAHLTGVQLKKLQVICPPVAIQEEFAHRVAECRSIQSQQFAATAKAESTFDALLAQVFDSSSHGHP